MLRKIVIASESSFRREILSKMVSSNEKISVVETVRNNEEAIDVIKKKNPNILLLDIEFTNQEWFEQFYTLIGKCPIITIILTDTDPKILDSAKIPIILKSYDYIVKPKGVWKDELPKIREKIISKIEMAHILKIQKIDSKSRLLNKNNFIHQSQKSRSTKTDKLNSNAVQKIDSKSRLLNKNNFIHQSQKSRSMITDRLNSSAVPKIEPPSNESFLDLSPVSVKKLETKVIVIGASVGGPRTLRTIFSDIPRGFPAPILVVQHMNHMFMRQLATSIKSICKIDVKIGLNNEQIRPGIIYISPGEKHMQVAVKNGKPSIRTYEGKPVNFCRPSVDVLFYSTARVYREKTLGILLTGMGRDGAAGLQAIKSRGGKTIAESEETSVMYGMPKVAAEIGAADLILNNYEIVDEMIKFVS